MDLFTLMGKIVIESGESTTEIDNMIAKAQSLNGLLGGTTNNAENTSKSLVGSTKNAAAGFGKAVSTMQIALGNLATQGFNKLAGYGKDFFQTGFEFNQNMEKWTASFKTYMGGDLEKAQAFMEEVRQFAIDTPLSLESSVQSAVRLMASGIESNEIIDKLRMLGDIANGDTEKMSRLGLVLSQVLSAKKLKGNDPNQFKEAGVPIYELLLDYYHANGYDYIDSAFLMEMQAKGGITSDEVLGALEMATSSGGLYYNAMNNIMDTEYGKAQKMKDAYEQAAGAATKAIFDVFSSDTIPALSNILEQLNEWANKNPEALKNLSQAFSDFATTGLSALLDGLTGLIDFWNEHQGVFSVMLAVLGGIMMTTGHPLAGVGLLAAGGYGTLDDMIEEVKSQWAEEGVEDGEVRDPLGSGVTYHTDPNAGLSAEALAALEESSNDTAAQRKGILSYFNEGARNFVESLWDYERLGINPYEGNALYPQQYAAGMQEIIKSLGSAGLPATEGYANSIIQGLFSWLGNYDGENLPTYWFTRDDEDEGGTSSSLDRLKLGMHDRDLLFASLDGVPAGRYDTSIESDDGEATMVAIQGLAAVVQGLAAEVASLTGSIPEAIASGISGITVTGHVSTGNVTLNTGALVGHLTPSLNLALGSANKYAARGVR